MALQPVVAAFDQRQKRMPGCRGLRKIPEEKRSRQPDFKKAGLGRSGGRLDQPVRLGIFPDLDEQFAYQVLNLLRF